MAKPTLEQIFYEGVKITRSDWAPGQYLVYADDGYLCQENGILNVSIYGFVQKHYSQYDWQIWEEPLPKPQDCPFCGNTCRRTGADKEHWVRCVDANCVMEGPVRKTRKEAIITWNRIRVEAE